jgi:hypothetical protein
MQATDARSQLDQARTYFDALADAEGKLLNDAA